MNLIRYACIMSFFCALAAVPGVSAQASQLKPAMVRIRSNQNGSGFIFRYDEEDQTVYLLTNEHVVRGAQNVNVQFFSGDTKSEIKSVRGTVVRQDPERDLAVVKVTGKNNIPSHVMIIQFGPATAIMPGDSVEVLSYSSQDEEWSVTRMTRSQHAKAMARHVT